MCIYILVYIYIYISLSLPAVLRLMTSTWIMTHWLINPLWSSSPCRRNDSLTCKVERHTMLRTSKRNRSHGNSSGNITIAEVVTQCCAIPSAL